MYLRRASVLGPLFTACSSISLSRCDARAPNCMLSHCDSDGVTIGNSNSSGAGTKSGVNSLTNAVAKGALSAAATASTKTLAASSNFTSTTISTSTTTSTSIETANSTVITSPDSAAEFDFSDDEIPRRFLVGCNNDIVEARRRYALTRAWRAKERVDSILQERQPHFFTIKSMYPHFVCSRGKEGHVIYWERAGELHIDDIVAKGITVDDLLRHWIFITEYQWNIICKDNNEDAKSITVIDIAKCSSTSLWGYTYEFVQRSVTYANMHYPDRSHAILIVNAPWWFSYMWKVIKPWVHEITQKKVRILDAHETLPGLQEYIDIDRIPVFYGGNLRYGDDPDDLDCCRFYCPETLALNDYVKALNEI